MRALLLLLLASTALARELPNVDAFLDAKTTRALPDTTAFDGHVSGVEERLGVPTFFWAAPPRAGTRSFRAQGLSPEQAARRHLFTHAGLYRALPAQLAEASLVRLHDTGQGALIATFEKRVSGVSVFRDRLNVAMNQQLELVALTGYLSPATAKDAEFKLTAATAFAAAWLALTGAPIESFHFREGALDEAGFRRFTTTLEQPFSGRAKKVFYPLPERLVPAWHLELELGTRGSTSSEHYAVVISAGNGALLSRKNLTESEQFTYRVWAESSGLYLPHDGPQGIVLSPHPAGTPNGFDPPFTQPALVTLQNGPISTNDPWLAPNATETTGNNVDAYADLATPDGFGAGDLRATTTSSRTFDRTYDTALAPNVNAAQQQAGITQLFFDINQLHDWFYDRGFNEAAGNAQTNNFSRGGAGNDSIRAEAQDVGGTDNANMSTPADGARPRMQMYVWVPSPITMLSASPGGTYPSGSAGFGSTAFNFTAQAMLAVDAVAPVNDGCTALTGSYTGRIVVVDRGTCTFARKAQNAQDRGAVGVIIVDNVASSTPPFLAADSTITTVTIPVLSVTESDGDTLKTNLGLGAVNVTMTRSAVVRRAGELDNTIVAHEWGHYLSNRLISDAAGLTNNQGRSMGEGWGDTISMLLMVRDGDQQLPANANFGGVYAAAIYAMGGPAFLDASYFGIRRYPYSTDLTKNPLTFRHIENGVALPSGPPRASGGASNAEVHNSGELWAVTLWECYAALLQATPRLTFDQARDRFMRYLVAGLKLTPAQPTFTEARDAMLAAAAANDVMDFQLFAAAFAKRGLGLRAVAPGRSSTNHSGVVEDFTVGSELVFVGATLDDEARYCDRDGVLDAGELGNLRLTLRNTGVTTLSATTGRLSSQTSGVIFLNPNVTFSSALPFAQSTGSTQVALVAVTAPTEIVLTLEFNDPQLMSATPRTATIRFRVHSDTLPASSATDDAETTITAWTFVKDTALSSSFDWRRKVISPAQSVWFGIDPGGNADISLVSPLLTVAPTGNLGLVLNHRWDFEADATTNYDGAVIEVSRNGLTWTDVGTAVAGYTGTLGGSGSNNPLVGRAAYTGRSPNYPAFNTDTLDLGASYAGQVIQVRLRIGADQAAAGAGWDVDSIGFTGITNRPFPSLVADRGMCINRPPVADAGPNIAVDERSQVTLSAAASTDLDADMLTPAWTQVGGPAVTLVNGVFIAPEVTVDTLLTFELVVNDGTVNSAPDSIEVLVRQVNRAPVAMVGPALRVDEGSTVTLAGSGSDPDGDPITSLWAHTAGPVVTLSDPTSATAQFTAPNIGQTIVRLRLDLTVSDGSLTSAPERLDIEVLPVNDAPSVTIVGPATATRGTLVELGAMATDPDGDTLTYSWRQTSGPSVFLLDASTANTSFAAPMVAAETALTFEVTVSDGALSATASATVSITTQGNRPPVVQAVHGDPRPGAVVQLDASSTVDPDGDPLTFAWTQTEGAPVQLGGDMSAVASFTMPNEGQLTFTVTVTDSLGASAQESLTLRPLVREQRGCGCTSSEGLFFLALPLLLAFRRRRSAKSTAPRRRQ